MDVSSVFLMILAIAVLIYCRCLYQYYKNKYKEEYISDSEMYSDLLAHRKAEENDLKV